MPGCVGLDLVLVTLPGVRCWLSKALLRLSPVKQNCLLSPQYFLDVPLGPLCQSPLICTPMPMSVLHRLTQKPEKVLLMCDRRLTWVGTAETRTSLWSTQSKGSIHIDLHLQPEEGYKLSYDKLSFNRVSVSPAAKLSGFFGLISAPLATRCKMALLQLNMDGLSGSLGLARPRAVSCCPFKGSLTLAS